MADSNYTTSCSGNGWTGSVTLAAGVDMEYATYRACDGGAPQVTYQIPVLNMDYLVTLKFAEIYFAWNGSRVFDVSLQGQTVLSKLDLFHVAGTNRAYDITLPVNVTGGILSIDFRSIVSTAKVNAILIKSN